MFTIGERARLRSELLKRASLDNRITAGAITGSAALDREDPWSDIDLAFGIGDASKLTEVLSDWTNHMYEHRQAIFHVDIRSAPWIYRVFLLSNTLQVDLAFVPATDFRALAPSFRPVFGTACDPLYPANPDIRDLIGMGLLYALHARSSIARAKLWQAEYMVSGLRDTALALACIRHGLPAVHARGMDQLPGLLVSSFEESLIRKLEVDELLRAFKVVTAGFLAEIYAADRVLGERLQDAVESLIRTG